MSDDARAVEPVAGPIDATVWLPGSKSITNRALVCAALAEGTSRLRGVLFADDTEAMLGALADLGVAPAIDRSRFEVTVEGTAGAVPHGEELRLDARMSGTTARFLTPLLALGSGSYVLDAAEQMRVRPMGQGIDAVEALGASVTALGRPGHLPLAIRPAGRGAASADEVRLRADVSSQFASGLLLCAPARPGGLRIVLDGPVVSRPYLDMTVAVMAAFGVAVDRPDERTYVVPPGPYRGTDYEIEPDASAASYFFAAPAIVGGRVRVLGLGARSLQGDVRFVDALEQMGASVTRDEHGIEVRAGRDALAGIDTDFADLSDTAQTLAVTAVFADGPTTIDGIGFIRRKETDRIAATATELRRCGISATELDDGLRVMPGTPRAAAVHTYDDHRMAMSFALLGLRTPGLAILDPGCVAKTFPTYWDVLATLATGGNAAVPGAGTAE